MGDNVSKGGSRHDDDDIDNGDNDDEGSNGDNGNKDKVASVSSAIKQFVLSKSLSLSIRRVPTQALIHLKSSHFHSTITSSHARKCSCRCPFCGGLSNCVTTRSGKPGSSGLTSCHGTMGESSLFEATRL